MTLQQPVSILLVEGDECSCEIISSLLAKKFPQAQIHNAVDWKAGLDSFRRNLPNIVITDRIQSEMGGVRILDKIYAIKPYTRVIFFTSLCDSRFLEKISRSGVAVELVPKPIDIEILFTSIKRCVASLARVN